MKVSVVVPCFNEAERLDADAFSQFREPAVSFLFVDDGSSDATGDLLASLAASDPSRFQVLTLARNVGKAEAVRLGLLRALETGPDYVGFLDSDLSTPLTEIRALVRLLVENPRLLGVLGSRVRLLGRQIDRALSRHLRGRVFATLTSMVLRLPVYDTQCGAKFFRNTPEVVALFEEPFLSRWIFDVEIVARFSRLGAVEGFDTAETLVEYPLAGWTDVPGSKFRLRHGLRALIDLGRIRRRYR